MNKDEADRLARAQKIDISMIIREEWEMKILQILFDSPLGRKIYFKGGTALRLGYGSPRFSEDLDFSVINKQIVSETEMENFVSRITKTYPNVTISDKQNKFKTQFVEFKISDPLLVRNFALKVEISTRVSKFEYQNALLISPTTNLQILANLETLDSLLTDKTEALSDRGKPRDLFDVWFICQKTKQALPSNLPKIPKREIRQELNRFLPVIFAPVVKELEDRFGL